MKMKINLEVQKQIELRELYLDRFKKGCFVDIQRIKYEIRKVKSRKNNNKLEVISKRRKEKIILIINGNEVLEMKYKEGLGELLVGITLAITNFIKLILIDRVTAAVALVVCITLVITLILAKIIGCSLPILAKKCKFDPAVMASPFITTIVDAISLFAYFKVATIILGI